MRSSRKNNSTLSRSLPCNSAVGQQFPVAHHVVDRLRVHHQMALLAKLCQFGKVVEIFHIHGGVDLRGEGPALGQHVVEVGDDPRQASMPRRLANRCALSESMETSSMSSRATPSAYFLMSRPLVGMEVHMPLSAA